MCDVSGELSWENREQQPPQGTAGNREQGTQGTGNIQCGEWGGFRDCSKGFVFRFQIDRAITFISRKFLSNPIL
jgi:hypothetical protein